MTTVPLNETNTFGLDHYPTLNKNSGDRLVGKELQDFLLKGLVMSTQRNINVLEVDEPQIERAINEFGGLSQAIRGILKERYLGKLGEKTEAKAGSVPVYEEEIVIALVEYNNNLDVWDGHNFTGGSAGRHSGLAKLIDGRYVLISGSDWQGEKDTAEIISAGEALNEILGSGCLSLLEDKKFGALKLLSQEKLLKEVE